MAYNMQCKRCGYSDSVKERSGNQNRYYWGCVVRILSEDTGYTKDEIHEIIKRKFLTEHRIFESKKGNKMDLELSKSTKELDTKQWEELMSDIRSWSSIELSIYIPEPNEAIK